MLRQRPKLGYALRLAIICALTNGDPKNRLWLYFLWPEQVLYRIRGKFFWAKYSICHKIGRCPFCFHRLAVCQYGAGCMNRECRVFDVVVHKYSEELGSSEPSL